MKKISVKINVYKYIELSEEAKKVAYNDETYDIGDVIGRRGANEATHEDLEQYVINLDKYYFVNGKSIVVMEDRVILKANKD